MSKKVALVIGVSYLGTDRQLGSSINSARKIKNLLINDYGFNPRDVKVLLESNNLERDRPNKKNILDQFKRLVRKSRNGFTNLWVYYTGLSSTTLGQSELERLRDLSGDEVNDVFDSAIIPTDFVRNGVITDNTLRTCFSSKLDKRIKVTAFFDSVHFNSPLDLRFRILSGNRAIIETRNVPKERNSANILCINNRTSKVEIFVDKDQKELQSAATVALVTVLRNKNFHISVINLVREMKRQLKKMGIVENPLITANRRIDNFDLFSTTPDKSPYNVTRRFFG